jgi:CheY-like chemotaxis protein
VRNDGADNEHVLLVEDNPVNQTVIEAMLRSLGFVVSRRGWPRGGRPEASSVRRRS